MSGRSDLSWEDSVRLDLSYVENWSMVNDLLIVLKTVRVVANGRVPIKSSATEPDSRSGSSACASALSAR